jgi:ribosomal protein S18 acetylase RimI-like enzyme
LVLGATAMWITPWAHNLRALEFYRKHGYADVGATYFRMGEERRENRVIVQQLVDDED